MPEGALLTHTVESVLRDLADSRATGCLLVRDQEGDEAEVYLRDGQVYAVSVPGRRVMLGVRLMSRGALTPEALAEALEIQRTELQGWRLGELLVHLGYVELSVVEEFVVEHLKDALTDLLGWPVAAWKFRKNKKTRQDVAPPDPRRGAAGRPARAGHHVGDHRRRHRGACRGTHAGRRVSLRRGRSGPERVGPPLQGRRDPGRRRAGCRVRVHAVRGRPGRHAACRSRARRRRRPRRRGRRGRQERCSPGRTGRRRGHRPGGRGGGRGAGARAGHAGRAGAGRRGRARAGAAGRRRGRPRGHRRAGHRSCRAGSDRAGSGREGREGPTSGRRDVGRRAGCGRGDRSSRSRAGGGG